MTINLVLRVFSLSACELMSLVLESQFNSVLTFVNRAQTFKHDNLLSQYFLECVQDQLKRPKQSKTLMRYNHSPDLQTSHMTYNNKDICNFYFFSEIS